MQTPFFLLWSISVIWIENVLKSLLNSSYWKSCRSRVLFLCAINSTWQKRKGQEIVGLLRIFHALFTFKHCSLSVDRPCGLPEADPGHTQPSFLKRFQRTCFCGLHNLKTNHSKVHPVLKFFFRGSKGCATPHQILMWLLQPPKITQEWGVLLRIVAGCWWALACHSKCCTMLPLTSMS